MTAGTSAQVRPGAFTRAPFRSDIQGLRAVAVGLVVVYHAGATWLSGGYVGVDVFFVISGFLITNHLLDRIERPGGIGFADFYARRVRRILPASFAVLVLSLVAAMVFMPSALKLGALWDGIWTALYIPNLAFAIDGTDYLAEAAPSVFQHYWSLGVEEQFYLFWPLVLLLLWRLARGSRVVLTTLVIILIVFSCAAGIWLTYRSQPWAFFALPTRAWELGAGALIAVAGPSVAARIPPLLRDGVSWLGLCAVVASAFIFDSLTAFPGVAAILPVAGTVAVIMLGQVPSKFGPGRLLSVRPMQFIGKISYSLYLVHWPLLVIPAAAAGFALDPWFAAALGVASVPVAWLLNIAVEEPARQSRFFGTRRPRWSLAAAGIASAATVAVALALMPVAAAAPMHAGRDAEVTGLFEASPEFSDFVPANLTPSLDGVSDDVATVYGDGCHLNTQATAVQRCSYGDLQSTTVVALFGDSHAAQWFPALERVAHDEGLRLDSYTKSSCPSVDVPIYDDGVLYEACATWRDAVIEHLAATRPDLVVLSNMADQPNQPDGGIRPAAWAAGAAAVVSRLQGTEAAVISDTPRFTSTPAICLSLHLDNADACSLPREQAIPEEWNRIEAAAAEGAGALVVDLNKYLCDATTCGTIVGNVLLYRDAHHLTATASTKLAPALWEALGSVLKTQRQ